ncbi:MAG: L,D-transpeptidase [Hyphomicrobiales bacterium]|nr:MAG: L,D-transpeptidase [Hyphomicrobiales bacterium]
MYRAMPDELFPLPAVDLRKVPERYYRAHVPDPTGEAPGTLYVDTANFYLYLVEENGMARRYGVGLGRAGFAWSGRARIAWKQKWPKWTPPDEMIERSPELEKYSVRNGGMPPGLGNPLGARALYIFEGRVDTLYRIHGTNEPGSIGRAVSSGCVRLLNQDVVDLYDRVRNGSSIVVV